MRNEDIELLSVFQAVAAKAARFPSRLALSGDERRWTYQQLIEDAERLAFEIAAHGCDRSTTIAVVTGNDPLSAVIWLASARLGSVVSLVNPMLRARELAGIFDTLQPRLVFCDGARLAACELALDQVQLEVECVVLDDNTQLGAFWSTQWLRGPRYTGPHPRSDDPHEISFTSGTTSVAKGVVLTHEAVLHRGAQEMALFDVGPDDAALVVTPLFHQSGIRDSVLLMWLSGGHATIAPKFESATFWTRVKQCRATYCCMVETMLLFLERQPFSACEHNNTLLRVLGNGDPEVLARMERRFELRFVNVYGMTEVGVPVATPMNLARHELQALRCWRKGASFAGWPLPGSDVRLVGTDGVVCGEGVCGEIQVRSPNLLRDYYRNPEATRQSLIDGWFQTGDLGMYGPHGSLYFVDRLKDIIRRGGENIASKEVESVLDAHPGVMTAAVIAVPDPLFQQEVKAIVVARSDAQITSEDLWRWCDDRLARYKVPRYIEFRDSMPLGGSGRIQKQLLRAEAKTGGRRDTYDRRRLVELA